jgi:hypothetical protein
MKAHSDLGGRVLVSALNSGGGPSRLYAKTSSALIGVSNESPGAIGPVGAGDYVDILTKGSRPMKDTESTGILGSAVIAVGELDPYSLGAYSLRNGSTSATDMLRR